MLSTNIEQLIAFFGSKEKREKKKTHTLTLTYTYTRMHTYTGVYLIRKQWRGLCPQLFVCL